MAPEAAEMGQASVACTARLVQREYHRKPGLNLTPEQANRLWGLDESICQAILDVLVDLRFLRRTAGGSYVRREAA